MRQQLLVDLKFLTLEGIDRSFLIHGIPQGDRRRQQRQSAGAIVLIFRLRSLISPNPCMNTARATSPLQISPALSAKYS